MVSEKFSLYVDQNQDYFVDKLREWVAIKSVSAFPENRDECFKMVNHVKDSLENLGAKVTLYDNPAGEQTFSNDIKLQYPPILVAEYVSDPSYKTVCIYGHLDVQPADISDGWSTDPFVLTEVNEVMFGRGASDDKGPVLGWLCALETFKACGIQLPINIKFIFEAMEESDSEGLDQFIVENKDGILKGVDFVCISDNYWLGTTKPCVTYGLRGIMYFGISVTGPKCDLHSGVFGGTVHEPMTDLVFLMSKLVGHDGKIMVPGVYDDVSAVTPEEEDSYKSIDFDLEEFGNSINVCKLIHSEKEKVLMHRWRFPSLSLHGIEGAFSLPGSKTVVPHKVTGKFSIRVVPNMKTDVIQKSVCEYLNKLHSQTGSPNKLEIFLLSCGPSWVSDVNNSNYIAARKATREVYGVDPDLTREGGSIPVTLTFEESLQKSVVLLPMGRGDDGAHSQNEKLDRSNFIKGIKLFAAYLEELSKV